MCSFSEIFTIRSTSLFKSLHCTAAVFLNAIFLIDTHCVNIRVHDFRHKAFVVYIAESLCRVYGSLGLGPPTLIFKARMFAKREEAIDPAISEFGTQVQSNLDHGLDLHHHPR